MLHGHSEIVLGVGPRLCSTLSSHLCYKNLVGVRPRPRITPFIRLGNSHLVHVTNNRAVAFQCLNMEDMIEQHNEYGKPRPRPTDSEVVIQEDAAGD